MTNKEKQRKQSSVAQNKETEFCEAEIVFLESYGRPLQHCIALRYATLHYTALS